MSDEAGALVLQSELLVHCCLFLSYAARTTPQAAAVGPAAAGRAVVAGPASPPAATVRPAQAGIFDSCYTGGSNHFSG